MAQSERMDLGIPPGVVRSGTPLSSSGRWYDSSLIRWYDGVMQAIGGWTRASVFSLTNAGSTAPLSIPGACRGSHAWTSNDGELNIALGYENSFRIIEGTGGVIATAATGYSSPTIPFGPGTPLVGHEIRTWQFDDYGEDVIGCVSDIGELWYADMSTKIVSRNPMSNAPTNNLGVVVTPERFIVALGAGGDNRRVAWASQGTNNDWAPTALNTAGDLDIPSEGAIVAGKRGRGETLIWTETDLFSLRYTNASIGSVPIIYGVSLLGRGGPISRRSMVMVGPSAYWMGAQKFWSYSGSVRSLPCTVSDFVFNDINYLRRSLIWTEHRIKFSEITWHYPSAGSTECDRYVTYNYDAGIWYFGEMGRSGGVDALFLDRPVLVDNSGAVWLHEDGTGFGSLSPYAETGIIDVGKGKRLVFIDEIYPDDVTVGSTFSVVSSDSPAGVTTTHGPYDAETIINTRIEARHLRFRVDMPGGARFGLPRVDARPAGER